MAINRGPQCLYGCKKRSRVQVQDSVVHVSQSYVQYYVACRVARRPSDETINRGTPRVYAYTKINVCRFKILGVHVRVRWKHQHKPACTKGFRVFKALKLGAIRNKKPSSVHTRFQSLTSFCLLFLLLSSYTCGLRQTNF